VVVRHVGPLLTHMGSQPLRNGAYGRVQFRSSIGAGYRTFILRTGCLVDRHLGSRRRSRSHRATCRYRGAPCHSGRTTLGRHDHAASWAAMALQDNPDYHPGLRVAAASNAMAGRPEQAHKALARPRRLNPVLRVSNLKAVLGPWRDDDLARYEEGLRQAGLPE
jgi:hypothetical protein